MEADADNPGGIELAPGLRVPESAVSVRFVRASGPGGQNVNKVSTAIELRVDFNAVARHLSLGAVQRLRIALGWRLTNSDEILLEGDERRTQEQNRALVLQRLRDLIVAARLEPKVRRRTQPTRASKRRRVDGKRHRGQIKRDRSAGPGD